MGKSTLLWHFIKTSAKFSNCFYIEKVDPNAIEYLFENIITAKTDSPVLLFIDDVVSSEENKKNLISFGEAIAEKSPNAPIALFAAERFYRYERFKEKKDFERNFSTVISLPYSNDSIRNKVFEKIYDSLNIAEENSSSKFKEDCQNIFNQYDFDSLIDSTYHLIKYLQKSTSSININYKFDWEDWAEACNNNIQKYGILEDLFKLVAFFYRYGITVPFDYLKEHYKNSPRINDLAREIIGNFGEEYSPIVLENDEDSEKRILRLRHEKMGEWFFQNTTDSKQVEKELFLEFIDNIKSKPACYLFRNIHRNAEFLLSHLHQYLSNKKRIKIIDGYLSTVGKSDYTEEEFKTLMEKHFTLINMGRSEDSLTPLEEILKHNEDNIFAATRLATCIENENPERAEKLYKQAQESSKKNKIITLSLYRLYYANPAFKQFEEYQNHIFEIASANTSFAFYLINFIENNISKLFQSTLIHILNLHSTHILIRLNIAELLINKRKIREAYEILIAVSEMSSNDECRTRNRIVSLLIELHEKQTNEKINSLSLAQKLIQKNFLAKPDEPYATYLYAKLLSQSPGKFERQKTEKYFIKAYELDRHNISLFTSITKFYRTISKKIIDEKDNIGSIIYLLKGISFIEKQLMSGFDLFSNQYKLELGLFLNELAKGYQIYSKYLSDPTNKYGNKIALVEAESEKQLLSCTNEIRAKFIKPDGELFYSHRTESLISLYSNGCSRLAKMYSNHAYRVLYSFQKTNDSLEESESKEYFTKAKQILEKAIKIDSDNPNTIVDLLEMNLALSGNKYVLNVEEINFEDFDIFHKIKLCKCLIKFKYFDTARKLLRKFGTLNSSRVFQKNDLAYCYIEVGEWGQAIRVLSEITNPIERSLKLFGRVALEMPVSNPEKARQKIEFSEKYLSLITQGKYPVKLNICETLFKSCNIDKSWQFYLDQLYRNNVGSPEAGFYELYKDWISGLIVYCTKLNAISETSIYRTNKFNEGITVISSILNNLFKIDYDFHKINFLFVEDQYQTDKKLHAIVGRSITALLFIVSANNIFSERAINTLLKISKIYQNPLFNKILLRKVIDPNKPSVLAKDKRFVEDFDKIYSHDRDVLGMLGRFYLENDDFEKSNNLFLNAQKSDRNNKEQCFSLSNLASWVITKIERQGINSFGDVKIIQEKLKEAADKIEKAIELYPEFIHAAALKERIQSIRVKYKIDS